MAHIERAVSAQRLFWIKDDNDDRIGLVWFVGAGWHWSVGAHRATDAMSYHAAIAAAESALGAPLEDREFAHAA